MQNIDRVKQLQEKKQKIEESISKVIVGQKKVVERLMTAIFANGHVLLIGVPGLAKTLMITSLAKSFSLDFKRVQFTPDLMPSDITGTEVIEQNRTTGEKEFKFIQGPIFSNIVLADEINRTPPKTQSALLQAMQEREISAGNVTYKMKDPFFVLATQNPIEQEGTYPLPEAQLDRFMFSLIVDYPSYDDELQIVKNTVSTNIPDIEPVLTAQEIIDVQRLVREIPVTDRVLEYAVKIVRNSRPNNGETLPLIKDMVEWGAGPRASQFLVLASKINAVLHGRTTPEKDDIIEMCYPVLRHRILPNFKAQAQGITSDNVIDELIKQI